MEKYLQGAVFYLLSFFIVGLIDSGIGYLLINVLGLPLKIASLLIIALTAPVLYLAFKKSLELFLFGKEAEKAGQFLISVAWMIHFISFIVTAKAARLYLLPLLKNPKLMKIGAVFADGALFLALYFLTVKAIVEKGGKVEA